MNTAEALLDLVDELTEGGRVSTARRRRLAECRTGWQAAEALLERRLLDRPETARRALPAFRRLARADGSREARGRAARLSASVLVQTDRPRAALRWYERAIRLLSGSAQDGARIGRAAAWLRLGRFDEAVRSCTEAALAADARDDALLAGAARLNLGVALHESGRHADALAAYRRAEADLERAGHAQLHATALQNTGNVLVLLQRLDEAADAYARAVSALDELGLSESAARCRYDRATLLALLDHPDRAELELLDARHVLERAGSDVQAALCRVDHAELLLRVGLLDEAREEIDAAVRGLTRRGPPEERARARLIQASVALAVGDPAAATRSLRANPRPEALPLRLERERLLARRDRVMGRPRVGLSRLSAALEQHTRELRRLPRSRFTLRLDGALAALESGDLDAARSLVRAADRDARSSGTARARWEAAALRFRVESRRGAVGARRHLERSVREFDRMTSLMGSSRFGARTPPGFESWLADGLRFVTERAGDAEAARSLLATLEGPAPVQGSEVSRAERDELLHVAARLRALSELDATSGGSGTRRSEAGVVGAARDLERLLERARPSASLVGAAYAQVDRLVCLHSDDTGTLVIELDGDDLRCHVHPLRRDRLTKLLAALDHEFGAFELDPRFAARRARRRRGHLAGLLTELGAPLAGLVDRAELHLLPTGAWRRVPWAAVRVDGRPLVRSTSPVALAGPGVRRAEQAGPSGAVILGYDDGSVPGVLSEARAVATSWSTGAPRLGESADCASVLGVRRPRLLHVAAHGRHRADAPLQSAVRLADGWLRAAELRSLDLVGTTVVLSGCRTGASPARGGREQGGFVRAALEAGAAEVVASLWSVDDPATERLMCALHERLCSGEPAAVALRAAQRMLLEEEVHPWYWAGFVAWARPAAIR